MGTTSLQTFGGALLVLEVALPHHGIAFFEGDDGVDLLLGFGDGAAHVAAADGEFQSGIPFVVVAEDKAGARLHRDGGDLLDGHFGPAQGGDHQVADIIYGCPVFFGEADADIKGLDAFVEGGGRFAADRHFDNGVGVCRGDAILGHRLLVEVDIQFRLADILDDAEVFDPADVLKNIIDIGHFPFHIVQRVAIDLYADGAFHPGYGFFDVVADRLGEVKVNAGDHAQLLVHRIDQFIFGDMRFPVVFGIEQHVEFVVVKAGDVGAVVGAAGLGGDDLDLRECHDRFADLAGNFHRFVEGGAVGQLGAEPDGALRRARGGTRSQAG